MAHTLLLVDDEENILKALRRLFARTGHEVLTAASGEEALGVLRERPVSLILSDQRMPGMTGAELLTKALALRPEAVRVMLTGHSDLASAMDAINQGRVYRFLAKPWDDAGLLALVEEALAEVDLKRRHQALQEEVQRRNAELAELNATLERRVLERTNELQMTLDLTEGLNDTLRRQNLSVVKAFAGLLDLRSQAVGAHCRRVAALVPPVCARLGVRDRQAVQEHVMAALLHDIGKIGLPDGILLKEPAHLGSTEREELRRHPVLGQGQVQVVEGLSGVAQTIRHHHEHLDGTGYPDGLTGEAVSQGARLLRVLDAYDHLTRGGARKGAEEKLALEALDRQVGRQIDGAVYNALLDVLEERKDAYDALREVKTPLGNLQEGMVLTRDLRTQSGILLVPKDEPIKQSYLDKIGSFTALYPTDPFAYVVRR